MQRTKIDKFTCSYDMLDIHYDSNADGDGFNVERMIRLVTR